MRPKLKLNEIPDDDDEDGYGQKDYFCFICNSSSKDKGLPLLVSETTYSHICLGQKLQEVLGNKFIVLISPKDSVCWDCAENINWIDKYELRLDIAKDKLLNLISRRYKKVEMRLEPEGAKKTQAIALDDEDDNIPVPDDNVHDDPNYNPAGVKEPAVPAKKKQFPCAVCHKFYATAAAAGAHAAKVHRSHFTCYYCDMPFTTDKKCREHIATAHAPTPVKEPTKLLSCVCGFKATNTEVYCRHVCNSAIMSLTCTTCKKRYVDSNVSKDKNLKYQCQACLKLAQDKVAKPVADRIEELNQIIQGEVLELPVERNVPAEENIIVDDIEPEINIRIEEPAIDGGIIDDMMVVEETEVASETGQVALGQVSYLKCTNCDEEFELSNLASHQCFASGDIVEYSEVERQSGQQFISLPMYRQERIDALIAPKVKQKRRIPKIPAQENSYINMGDNCLKMNCKTCGTQFKTIGLMRQHWDLTGHAREISTTTIELNKIKDKTLKTEKTFKVVKQNFNIRAKVQGQNSLEIKRKEENQVSCIVKVKEDMSLEDFIRMKDGRECEACGVLFGSEALLKEHQNNNCLTCITCSVTFFDNKLLKKHYQYTGHATRIPDTPIKKEFEPKVHYCHICLKTFNSGFILSRHIPKHYKGTNKGACHYCHLELEDKSHLQQHVLEFHGAQLYKCQHCDRTYLSENIRNRHQLKHMEFNLTVKGSPPKPVKEQASRTSSACRICGKNISNFQSLKRHETRHFYKKSVQCDLCGKFFKNKSSLKLHSHSHRDEEQFKCKTCGLGFKKVESLEEHQIVHIKKEYTCPKCPTICRTRTLFWMHLKLHDSAYMCSVCGQTYRDTSLLAIHRRKHWRVRPYQCPYCPRMFSVPATLRRHLMVHTKTYPHKCVLCKKRFLTRHSFHKHLDTVHSARQQAKKPQLHRKIPSLPLNATDEDIFQAADTLISDDTIMFNDYSQKDVMIEHVSASDLITNEVVIETTELFDVLT